MLGIREQDAPTAISRNNKNDNATAPKKNFLAPLTLMYYLCNTRVTGKQRGKTA